MFKWILLTLYILLVAFMIWQIDTWMRIAFADSPSSIGRRLFVTLVIIFLSIMPLLVLRKSSRFDTLKRISMLTGNVWLGWLMVGAVLFLLLWVFSAAVVNVTGVMPAKNTARALLLAVLILTAAFNVYGYVNAGTIHVRHYSVDISGANTAGSHGEMRAVLMSDLHIDSNTTPRQIRKIVRKVNRQDPDIVFNTGDFFSSSMMGIVDDEPYIKALQKISAPQGVYGVYGNHDVNESLLFGFSLSPKEQARRSRRMTRFIRRSGITMLTDDTVDIAGGSIQLTGRVDGETTGTKAKGRESVKDLMSAADGDRPVIVLEHEPWELDELGKNGADLILSGHTHGGQIFPGNLIVKLFNENGYGEKKTGGAVSIVTSGAGCYGPPIRIGSHSEIAVIDIKY
jgi:predicted MPP superfamily phosphohydrolase